MSKKVSTKVLSGFMELVPADQIAFDRMKEKIESVFKRHGFVAMDTPIIERAEVLVSKTGDETEKQIYKFTKGDTELALRFDLTVPLARYVGEHWHDLTFPFRRYAIGKSFRGENPQKGRFREFYQCDVDIVGHNELSILNDAEIIGIVNRVFNELNLGPFLIRISNRKLIAGLAESLGVAPLSAQIFRSIDKFKKVGEQAVQRELAAAGLPAAALSEIFTFLKIEGEISGILTELEKLSAKLKNETFKKGLEEIFLVVGHLKLLGVPEKNFSVDLKLARGLDYYTGTVYETIFTDHPEFDSVCGGGRYDNLTEKFTNEKFPGVGASIGLTRLFSQLKEAGLVTKVLATNTQVLVVPLVTDLSVPLKIASVLRSKNISTEIYLEDAKMKTKLAYADKLGIPYVVLVGEDEIKASEFTLKNMATGEQIRTSLETISEKIRL